MLEEKLVKRKVSLKALGYGKVEEATKGTVRQTVTLNVGITDEKAREIGKFIKGLGLKGVQHQVQGDQLRVSGKKRDDLQTAIGELRDHDFGIPLQFIELPRLTERARPARSGSAAARLTVDAAGRGAWGIVASARPCRRAMRSVGGCVRRGWRSCTLRPLSGLMMYAVACGRVHVHRHLLGVRLDLLERPGQRLAVADAARRRERSAWYSRERRQRHLDAAPPRSGPGSPWRAAPKMLPPSSSPPPPKIAPHIAMRAMNVMPIGDRGRDRPDQDVAVADVAELVGEHAAQLVLVEHLQDALRDRHDRVVGAAAGGEGVGLRLGRDVELAASGSRPAGPAPRRSRRAAGASSRVTGLAPGGLDRELVAEPVRAADEDEADAPAR